MSAPPSTMPLLEAKLSTAITGTSLLRTIANNTFPSWPPQSGDH